MSAFRRLHTDRPVHALRTAQLICTDLRWRRVTAPLIVDIEQSGILDNRALDQLGDGFLWGCAVVQSAQVHGCDARYLLLASGALYLEVPVRGGRERLEVLRVGADDKVSATQSPLGHAGVDDIGRSGLRGKRAGCSGQFIIEHLDVAPPQEPGQQCLSPASTPGLIPKVSV